MTVDHSTQGRQQDTFTGALLPRDECALAAIADRPASSGSAHRS